MGPSQSAATQRGHAPTRVVADAKVGVWRVIEHVGLARQRSTYAVTQIDSGASGLLEVYDAPPRRFGSYVERLRSVMHQVNRIEHPGVCPILDVGTLDDGRPYIVRAHVHGETLATRIRRRVLSTKRSLAIMLAICDALRATHACNVVHGALEPEHVMVCDGADDVTIKLLDWGICDEVRRAAAPGTMIVRIPPTRADDVHALGVMMHALFERIPAQLEPIWTAMLDENPSGRPTLAQVQSELRAVDLAALQEPRRDATPMPRPASERVIASAITPALTPQAVVTPAPTIDELPTPRRRPHRGAWLASLGVGAAAVAACVLYVVEHGASTARASTSLVQPRSGATRLPAIAETTPAPSVESVTPVVAAAAPTSIDRAEAPQPTLPIEPAVGQVTSPPPTPTTTITPVLAVAHRPSHTDTPAIADPMPDTDRDGSAAVMAQHQRVGHRLLELQRQFGPAAGAEVAKRFRWIKLDMALATPTSRRLLSMTLRDLSRRLEAARAQACTTAPDAALCRA